jgi:hypothetical protein
MPQPAEFGGFVYDLTQPLQRDMTTVTQTLRELPTLVNEIEAESLQNPPELENRLLH